MSLYEERYPGGSRKEHVDSTPMSVPVGFRRPPSLIEQMRSMIRNEMSQAAQLKGRETFEEANDFDMPDDPEDPRTPWEHEADSDDELAAGLDGARHAREARKAGWQPSPEEAAWQSWAKRNGWNPPPAPSEPSSSRPDSQAAQPPQGPSAGPNTSGKP